MKKVAIFIDVANVELSAKYKNWHIDYRKLYKWLEQFWVIVYAGFFTARFNTVHHDKFLTFLKKAGFNLITKLLKNIKVANSNVKIRKANFDVEIAVEAIKRKNDFEVMILLSGDSDFDYLLKELKKCGKQIVIVSIRGQTSTELIRVSDLYVDLVAIRSSIERK